MLHLTWYCLALNHIQSGKIQYYDMLILYYIIYLNTREKLLSSITLKQKVLFSVTLNNSMLDLLVPNEMYNQI